MFVSFAKVTQTLRKSITEAYIKKEGSKQFSNAIFLTENEIEDAKVLKSMGIKQFMQQVPTSKKEDLNTMI